MARILALDTSTEACSAALRVNGTLLERYEVAPREHMRRLLPMVDDLLAQCEWRLGHLDAIAFGRGPGSFTGLRICLSVVQGLAFGAGLPVLPVSTLAALAQTSVNHGKTQESAAVLAAIDARMGEVYWGWFAVGDDRIVQALGDEHVSAPGLVTGTAEQSVHYGAGTGWRYAGDLPMQTMRGFDAELLPRASGVLTLAEPRWGAGDRVAAEDAVPVYLRDEVAWQKGPMPSRG